MAKRTTRYPIEQPLPIKLSRPIISTGIGIALLGLSLFTVLPSAPEKSPYQQCSTVSGNGTMLCQPQYYERDKSTTLLDVWKFGFALISFVAAGIILSVEFAIWRDK